MFRLSVVVVALASFDAIVAAAARVSKRTYAVKEVFNPPPAWSKGRAADPNHVLRLRFGLPQGDFAALEEHLLQVSDPNHERYGAHLSKAEVESLVAPKQGHVSSVEEWLAEHGFGSSDLERSPAGDWIIIAVPVSKAEELLDTTYNVWTHADGTELVRTTTYSLPVDLHDAIEVVQPTNMFGRLRPNKATSFLEDYNPAPVVSASSFASSAGPTVDASCNATITPLCLQQLYNTVGYIPTNKDNVLGVAGYLEQYANFQDLKDFYAKYYPQAINSTLGVELISGGTNSQNISESGAEAALDVQYTGALTFPTKNIYYSTGGRPPFNPSTSTPTNTNEPYADWVDYMLKKDHPPQTVTTSYGDDEVTVPKSYAQRVCNSFAQLGARGVSLMFSSGDFGVGDGDADPATAVCLSNDGKNTTMFLPIFPGGCPYVTTVGGTHFITPEVAVAFTGGGFSNYFERPLYQTLAVAPYVAKLGKTYKGLYNPKGRAYPDVAAQGSHFRIILSGVDRSIGGTSASSPAFASVISLVNDARLNAHLPPLGFLNPWLYTVGWAGLNDITVGNNPGCGTPGFNATVGWDPVTGLGTPNFQKLKKLAGVIF